MRPSARIRPLLIVALVAAGPLAGSEQVSVSGRVVDECGTAIAGASVTVRQQETPIPYAGAQTNETGGWELQELPSGDWLVAVEAEGYANLEEWNRFDADVRGLDLVLAPDGWIRQREWAKARSLYESRLGHSCHDDVQLLLWIAWTYEQEGDHENELATHERVLEVDPDNVASLVAAGNLLWAADRRLEAFEYFKRWPADRKVSAQILEEIQYLGAAGIAYFDHLLANDPDDVEIYYLRAITHLQLGQNCEARRDFESLLRRKPDGERAPQAREFLEFLEPCPG